MATITTTEYLDEAARTAGEVMTINGGRLIVRTDTRWHPGAPASMTGSLGSLTISATLGGGYELDGTRVRQLHYTDGTGNALAFFDKLTGDTSGAEGIVLGFWASDTSAPTAVGAAIPASGFVKFLEVTGAFSDGEVVTGGSVSLKANDGDRVSWIEVVHDQTSVLTIPRLGDFKVRGDWYVLGYTNGVANQILQVPTNGSPTTYVPGVWIATTASPAGPEDFEFWPAVYASGMSTTNLGTDVRSKVVLMGTDGTIRIGHNGTTAVGYVPPAGRQVRIPNVLGRQCTTAARNENALHTTIGSRPRFTTTSAGVVDIENFLADWYFNTSQPYSLRLHHIATFETVTVSECAQPVDLYDGGNGSSAAVDASSLRLSLCLGGGTVDKWSAMRSVASTIDYCVYVSQSLDFTLSRVQARALPYARGSSSYAFYVSSCSGFTLSACRSVNQIVYVSGSRSFSILNQDHVDRAVGGTNSTTALSAITVASSQSFLVDGLTFGFGGAVANCHPYTACVSLSTCSDVRIRNFGSRTAVLNGGSANQVGYILTGAGANNDVKIQRCYVQPTRTGMMSTVNSDTRFTIENVFGDFADSQANAQLSTDLKGCAYTFNTSGQTSVYGTHWFDHFTSSTDGAIGLSMNEPTVDTASVYTVVAGSPKFTSTGQIVMQNVGDEAIWEMPYFAIGHDSLYSGLVVGTNITFSSGSRWGNHDIYFQIDKGDGWNGSWIAFNATNIAANGASTSAGVKLKLRVVCAVASTTNAITNIRFVTTSSLASQTTYLYPLDTFALTLTGLKNPTEVRVYDAANPTGQPIAGQENVTSGTFTTQIDAGTYPEVNIAVMSLGYQNLRYVGIDMTGGDVEIPVFQTLDRQYHNPA